MYRSAVGVGVAGRGAALLPYHTSSPWNFWTGKSVPLLSPKQDL